MHIANRIASGDLSVRVETRAGDAQRMLFALRNMRERVARCRVRRCPRALRRRTTRFLLKCRHIVRACHA
jgi:hypothetical protein